MPTNQSNQKPTVLDSMDSDKDGVEDLSLIHI